MKAEDIVRAISFRFVTGRLHRHIGTISGLEHIPMDGSFVLIPNHRSYFDHFAVESLIDAVRGTPTWFLTKHESFEKRIPRTWARAWYGIPVNRDVPSPNTILEVNRVLKSGDVLCVYPEGTRGSGAELLPFKPGAFRFGLAQNVPLIPLGLVGTNEVLAKGDKWFKPGTIHLAFGPPLEVPTSGTKQEKADLISAESRGVLEHLIVEAANHGTALALQNLTADNAQNLEAAITTSLDEAGRLSKERIKGLTRLAKLLLAAAPDDPDLQAQLVRLHGLKLTNSASLIRLLGARRLRLDAEAILRSAPDNREAAYLLGRWHLAIPQAFGGSLAQALRFFEQSSMASKPGDTRALSGLAEAYLATGQQEDAIRTLHRVIAETPADHPRVQSRVRKAEKMLEVSGIC